MRKILTAVFLLFCIFLWTPFTEQAHAGSYFVLQCADGPGSGRTDGVSEASSSKAGNIQFLPVSSGACTGGRYVGANRSGSVVPEGGEFRGWRWDFPGGLKMTEVRGGLAACRRQSDTNDSVLPQMVAGGQVFSPNTFSNTSREFTTASHSNSSCGSYADHPRAFTWGLSGSVFGSSSVANLPSGGVSSLRFRLLCGNNDCRSGTGQYSVGDNLRIRLQDNTAPTLGGFWGPWLEEWGGILTDAENPDSPGEKLRAIRNTASIASQFVDTGGGIDQTAIIANGLFGFVALDTCSPTTGTSSRYPGVSLPTAVQPCPLLKTSLATINPNSAPWVEGLNSVATLGYDYASDESGGRTDGYNSSAVTTRRFIIDRTAPPVVAANSCYFFGSNSYRNGWWVKDGVSCGNGVSDLNPELPDPTMVAGIDTTNDEVINFWQQGGLSYEAQVLRTGATRYWPMNSSSQRADISASGLDLVSSPYSVSTPRTLPTFDASAQTPVGQGAWDFSSATEGLTGEVPNEWSSETLSAWVRPENSSKPGNSVISEQRLCINSLFYSCLESSHSLQLSRQNGAIIFEGNAPSPWSCSTSAGAVKNGRWAHVVAARRAEETSSLGTTSGEIKLFVNGSLVKTCANTVGATGETEGKIIVGSSIYGGTTAFSGQISQVALFNGYLENDAVKQMYLYGCRNAQQACYTSEGFTYKPVEGQTTMTVSAADRVGNRTGLVAKTAQVDYTTPVVTAPVCSGTEGKNGWYTSSLSCLALGADNISKPKPDGLTLLRQTGTQAQVSEAMTLAFQRRTNLLANPGATAGTRRWEAQDGAFIAQIYKGAVTGLPRGNTSDSEAQGVFLITSDKPSQFIASPATLQRGKRYVCSMSAGALFFPEDWTISIRDRSGAVKASANVQFPNDRMKKVELAYRVPDSAPVSEELLCGVSRSSSYGLSLISHASVEELELGGAMPFFDGFTPGASWDGSPSVSPSSLDGSLARGTLEVSAEGQSSLQTSLEDNAGNQSGQSASLQVKIDRSDPSVSLSESNCTGSGAGTGGSRVNGWWTSNVTCQATVTDPVSGPAAFGFSNNDGSSWTPVTLNGTGASKTASWITSADTVTPLTIKTQAEDVAGRLAEGPDLTLKIDRLKPQIGSAGITCTAPNGKDGWVRPPVSCTFQVQDTHSGPSSATWGSSTSSVGIPASQKAATLSGDSAEFSISKTDAQAGIEGPSVFLAAQGQDMAGLVSNWRWRSSPLKIDATDPVDETPVTAGSVADGELIVPVGTDPGGTNASGIDPDSIVCTVENLTTGLPIGAAEQSCKDGIPIGTGSTASVQSVRVTYTFADKAGNSVSGSRTYTVDNNRPNISASASSAWTNGTVTVQLSATKTSGSNVAALKEIQVSGAPAIAADTSGFPIQISGFSESRTVSFSAEGERTLTFVAVDTAGNQSNPKTVEIRIDKTAPEITSGPTSSKALPWTGVVGLSLSALDPALSLASGSQPGSGLNSVVYEICPVEADCSQPGVWREITVEDDLEPLPLTRRPGCGQPPIWDNGSSLCWLQSAEEADGRSVNQVRARVYDLAGNVALSEEIDGDTDNPACPLNIG